MNNRGHKHISTQWTHLWRARGIILLLFLLLSLFGYTNPIVNAEGGVPPVELFAKAQEIGSVRVIVRLNTPYQPEGDLNSEFAVQRQRSDISRSQARLSQELAPYSPDAVRPLSYIPYVAMTINAAGLDALAQSGEVLSIEEDVPVPPMLSTSTALIGADTAWASGYTGKGWVVAVLDTGVDSSHPFLGGRVVEEACYSAYDAVPDTNPLINSLCPSGQDSQTGTGAGANCSGASGCDHGTHVAGIMAGNNSTFSGVAKEAEIIAVQVFSWFDGSLCGGSPCVMSYSSDQIQGLLRVYELRNTYNIAAVNMSLGGGSYTSPCDSASIKASIDLLRSAGIATVIAAGNDGYTAALSSPGCVSSAVSVGSTTSSYAGSVDEVSSFSNSANFLDVLAPGHFISSSVPGTGYSYKAGTSMAAPHVAGAWAVLKSHSPDASVDEILAALTSTGVQITDSKSGITKPRIQIDAAISALNTSLPTATPTATPTNSPTPTATGTPEPTATATITPSPIPSPTSTTEPPSAPKISAIDVDTGSNNRTTPVEITGSHFVNPAAVSLGTHLLQNVTFVDSGHLRVVVAPDLPPDTYDLIVTNPDGEADVLPAAFTVESPALSLLSISPERGNNTLPNLIHVNGLNFSRDSTVRLGDEDQITVFISNTHLWAIVLPGKTPGLYDVSVVGADSLTVTLTDAYTVFSAADDDLTSRNSLLWNTPGTLRTGSAAQTGLVLYHQGGNETLEDVVVRFYAVTPSGDTLALGDGTVTLPPNSTDFSSTVSWTPPVAGMYTLRAVIDPDNVVTESNEGNNVIERAVAVLAPAEDTTPPTVNSFSAALEQGTTAALSVSATDPAPGTGVNSTMFIEYEFSQSAAQWISIRQSGWLKYKETPYAWETSSTPGLKYLQVWVADKAGNVSLSPGHALLNVVPPTDILAGGQARVYRYPLATGEQITVRTEPISGDADIYLWTTGTTSPDLSGDNDGTAVDQITYTATQDMLVQVVIYGYTATEFAQSIEVASEAKEDTFAQPNGISEYKTPPAEEVIAADSTPSQKQGLPSAPVAPGEGTHTVYLPLVNRGS